PDHYAEVLLGISQPEDGCTAQKVKAMYGSTERTITLKRPIPVYVTYQTAFVDESGKAQQRADIYGLDKDITHILRSERRIADVPMARNYNQSSKPVVASAPNRREPPGYSSFGWDSGWGGFDSNWRSAYRGPDRFKSW